MTMAENAATGQTLRVTAAEAKLTVSVGALLGAAVAGWSLQGVRAAVEAELDQDVALVVPWGATVAACAGLALIATTVPILRGRRG